MGNPYYEELDLYQDEIDDCLDCAIEKMHEMAKRSRGQISMVGVRKALVFYGIEKVPNIVSIAVEKIKSKGVSIGDAMNSGTQREAGTR
jgi:hypothetical protein